MKFVRIWHPDSNSAASPPIRYYTATIKFNLLSGSIVVSIPACHAGDRGSIPRQRVFCPCDLGVLVYVRCLGGIFWFINVQHAYSKLM